MTVRRATRKTVKRRPRSSSARLPSGPVISRLGADASEAGPPAADHGFRIGCGTDVHPLAPGRSLVLGGVTIPHDRGLQGHSDADVLAHAICDALLGALGLADMGTRFPDTDESLRGRSSLLFLKDVMIEARARGFEIVNLDSVVLAEAPRLQPHIDSMREKIAAALDCPAARVGVKAKRFEGLGAVGRREGIMAQAVVLLGTAAPRRAARSGAGPRS